MFHSYTRTQGSRGSLCSFKIIRLGIGFSSQVKNVESLPPSLLQPGEMADKKLCPLCGRYLANLVTHVRARHKEKSVEERLLESVRLEVTGTTACPICEKKIKSLNKHLVKGHKLDPKHLIEIKL